MRYTTVIDITDHPEVYGNQNARLVYFHMALKSGYHDDDRDQLKTSYRRLAADVGLTVSATRHAIAQLERASLISREGDVWRVKKWIIDNPPTPRPRKQQAAAATAAGKVSAEMDRQMLEYQQALANAVRQMSRDELEQWLEELREGRSIRHYGAQLNANQRNIEWLTNVIKRL